MMPTILLLIEEGENAREGGVSSEELLRREGYQVVRCRDASEAAARLRELATSGTPAAGVLVGGDVPAPVAMLRQIYRIDPQAQVVFLTDERRREQLQRELMFAPMHGGNWTFAPTDDAPVLLRRVESAVRSASQRLQLRTTLDRINAAITSTSPPDSSDYRKLVISDHYLASIQRHARDAIISTDPGGRIISWNRGAERLFGYSEREIAGESVTLLVAEEHRSSLDALLEQARTEATGGTTGMPARRSDGSTFDIEISADAFRDGRGTLLGMSVIARDVTERNRLLEREREARMAAEESNRLKDEFLATVSHELRTPLTAILGWADILESMTFDDELVAQAVDTIRRNAEAQRQLIEDLLDVSRIVTGKLRLDVRPVDLAAVIEAAVNAVRPAADAREIGLQTVLDPKAGPVPGDAERLQQVMWNLLSNAIKFTPKKGRVQVRLQRIASHVEIMVSDTGVGIDPEFLPYVFDRFRQADQRITRNYGGLGLGLAIVRHLVELHGGTVHVHSDGEGKGSTFTVKLPQMALHEPSPDSGEVHPTVGSRARFTPSVSLSGTRVLVVDDEPDTCAMIRTVLERSGAVVRIATSAVEGLALFNEWRPDVLLSDIGMPEEDGYTLIRRIRECTREKGGQTPAAALTAYAREDDRIEALLAGFQIHIPKPVKPAELVAVVANLAGLTGGESRKGIR